MIPTAPRRTSIHAWLLAAALPLAACGDDTAGTPSGERPGGMEAQARKLNLPTEFYSLGLRRLVALEAAKVSFDEVVAAVKTTTGIELSQAPGRGAGDAGRGGHGGVLRI
jgi:hypothetical protein